MLLPNSILHLFYSHIISILTFIAILFNSGIVIASNVDSLLTLIDKTNNKLEKSELYIKLGDKHEYTEPGKAFEYYQMAYELANSVSMTTSTRSLSPEADLIRAKSRRYMGIVKSDQGEYEKALTHYDQALNIYEKLRLLYTAPFKRDIEINIAKLQSNIGVVYSRQGVYNLAREYYEKSLEIYQELKDTNSLAVTYSSLGIVEARRANMNEALRYFQQALDNYASVNNAEGLGQSYNNIGNVYSQMGDWDEALELFLKAHDLYVQLGYQSRVATTKTNIGLSLQSKGEFSRAKEYLLEGLKIRQDLNERAGIIESLNNLGQFYFEQAGYDVANDYFRRSHELAVSIGDQRMIAQTLMNIGRGYFLNGLYHNAIETIHKAAKIAHDHDLKFIIQSSYDYLAQYYAAINNFKSAFHYSKEHFSISQEILNEQRLRQINELEIEYKAREKQRRIENLEKEQEINIYKLRQTKVVNTFLALLFITGLVIAVFSILLLKQRNKIMLLNKESDARKQIQKTNNNLNAILETHAHGMLLLDNELNVIEFNKKAIDWFGFYAGISISTGISLQGINDLLIKGLMNDLLKESLMGYPREKEIQIEKDENQHYFKFFSNPVFEEDDKLVQSISLMIENITEQRVAEERILSNLKENETLVKEIHHRVKNNMQVIMSLIRMQSRVFSDNNLKESFYELERRIAAMSLVHEDLYKSSSLSQIRIDDYLTRISVNLSGVFGGEIKLYTHFKVDNSLVDVDIAMPCGLVVNELITNSFKHAFHFPKDRGQKEKRIDISLAEGYDGIKIAVSDNGTGIADDINPQKTTTMGFHLIRIIVEEQLKGSWEFNNKGGFTVSFNFKRK